jgi:hypothetical protein
MRLREERKKGINDSRNRWMSTNIMSRDNQMKEMAMMNEEYNKLATLEFLKIS